MTIPVTKERLDYGGAEGCLAQGLHRQVISGQAATRTLLPEESGALCLFDRAAGIVYTLPVPAVGMQFEFAVTVTITSNAAKIITDAATTFLVGELLMYSTATASPGGFAANGTTIRAVSANGSTTGGIIGERYRVTAISATQWVVEGVQVGSGTLATAFATS